MVIRSLIRFPISQIPVNRAEVLERIGLGPADVVGGRLDALLRQAAELFRRRAVPVAIYQEIGIEEFAAVYEGEGANAAATPLAAIYPRAEALALFAATLGRALDEEGRTLFAGGDPALGYVLDVTASSAADRLADLTTAHFVAALTSAGRRSPASRALPYSPGYCGWHVSGQWELFDRLRPEPLGLELTAGALMDPLKSVSGVIVAGPARIHRFRPDYVFCDACVTHECRARMASVLGSKRRDA